jgi:hypothetical protein
MHVVVTDPGRHDEKLFAHLFQRSPPSPTRERVGTCIAVCRVEETALCFRLSLALSAVSGFVRV